MLGVAMPRSWVWHVLCAGRQCGFTASCCAMMSGGWQQLASVGAAHRAAVHGGRGRRHVRRQQQQQQHQLMANKGCVKVFAAGELKASVHASASTKPLLAYSQLLRNMPLTLACLQRIHCATAFQVVHASAVVAAAAFRLPTAWPTTTRHLPRLTQCAWAGYTRTCLDGQMPTSRSCAVEATASAHASHRWAVLPQPETVYSRLVVHMLLAVLMCAFQS
jgi:hypothetical protein